MSEEKTSWRKNIDSNFISGEDLANGESLGKGLKKEMTVVVESFQDRDTFDVNTQSKIVKSAIYLRESGGKSLYKPVLLNKTNAQFFEGLTGSQFLDDWIGSEVTLFAKPDSRHGHVVRFRKAPIRIAQPTTEGLASIAACETSDALKALFLSLDKDAKLVYAKAKDARKLELENDGK